MGKVNGGGSREKDTVKARQGCSVMQLLKKKTATGFFARYIRKEKRREKRESTKFIECALNFINIYQFLIFGRLFDRLSRYNTKNPIH